MTVSLLPCVGDVAGYTSARYIVHRYQCQVHWYRCQVHWRHVSVCLHACFATKCQQHILLLLMLRQIIPY